MFLKEISIWRGDIAALGAFISDLSSANRAELLDHFHPKVLVTETGSRSGSARGSESAQASDPQSEKGSAQASVRRSAAASVEAMAMTCG